MYSSHSFSFNFLINKWLQGVCFCRDSRKYSMPEYPVWSKKSGDQPFNIRKMSMQAHEGNNLLEIDQDNLASELIN